MNRLNMIIFFAIFFLLYGLINSYVFLRGWQAMQSVPHLRVLFTVVFWLLALAFFIGRFLERNATGTLSTSFVWVGSFWFAAFAYFALGALLIDFLRLVNYVVPFFPSFITNNIQRVKLYLAAGLFLTVAVALAAGYINARSPRLILVRLSDASGWTPSSGPSTA
jgi:uncharacterized membrane protein